MNFLTLWLLNRRWDGFGTRLKMRAHRKELLQVARANWVRSSRTGKVRFVGKPWSRWPAYVLLVLICSIFGLCQSGSPAAVSENPAGADAPTLKKPIHGDDPDTSRSKEKSVPLAEADVHFSITFDKCRENEKHHVSCAFVDAEGYEHWVYLAGARWPIRAAK